jgi:prephenate dehydrogenase
MTVIAWVTLVAGIIAGGGIGYALGYCFGKSGAVVATINASLATETQAVDLAATEEEKITADAAAEIASIPGKSPEQIIREMEALK